MKLIKMIGSMAAVFLFIGMLPVSVLAAQDQLVIVSLFNKPLQFTVGLHRFDTPNLPYHFVLNRYTMSTIQTSVIKPEKNHSTTFISVTPFRPRPLFTEALFSVSINLKNHPQGHAHYVIRLHGLLDQGIAYSWTHNPAHTRIVVTLCTPYLYHHNGYRC